MSIKKTFGMQKKHQEKHFPYIKEKSQIDFIIFTTIILSKFRKDNAILMIKTIKLNFAPLLLYY